MKTLLVIFLLMLTFQASAADGPKRFLANNGRAIITISEIGEITVEGEATPEVLALVAMIRQAILHTCKITRT